VAFISSVIRNPKEKIIGVEPAHPGMSLEILLRFIVFRKCAFHMPHAGIPCTNITSYEAILIIFSIHSKK